MNTSESQVFDAALALPQSLRSELADKLVMSLPTPKQQRKQAWGDELCEQLDAFERGELETIDGPKALVELRRRQAERQSP